MTNSLLSTIGLGNIVALAPYMVTRNKPISQQVSALKSDLKRAQALVAAGKGRHNPQCFRADDGMSMDCSGRRKYEQVKPWKYYSDKTNAKELIALAARDLPPLEAQAGPPIKIILIVAGAVLAAGAAYWFTQR